MGSHCAVRRPSPPGDWGAPDVWLLFVAQATQQAAEESSPDLPSSASDVLQACFSFRPVHG